MNFQGIRIIAPRRAGVAAALLLALALSVGAVVSQETTVKRSVLDSLPANTSLVFRVRDSNRDTIPQSTCGSSIPKP